MFREMRRFRQELPENECRKILETRSSGVLAVSGDDGYPYAVPLSFVLDKTRIYFHSAKSGHKLDSLKRCDKASFCVIDKDDIVPEKYTTYYRSVVVFGRTRILDDGNEKREAFLKLAEKYSPNDRDGVLQEVEQSLARAEIISLDIEHMTGKEARELALGREGK